MKKHALRSKSILVSLAVIAISRAWPGFTELVSEYPETYVIMNELIHMALRLMTKTALRWRRPDYKSLGAVVVAVLVSACSSVPQKLDPKLFYRKDLPFCVAGVQCHEGVAVLPRMSSYEIEIAPKGDANIDLLLVTSCHREESFEKTSSGWFIFAKKNKFKYFYTPVPGIEDDGLCSLRVNTYEKALGRHSWSVIRFEHPKYRLPAQLTCNGSVSQVGGVSICQSKAGLVERIKFSEPVMVVGDAECPPMKRVGDSYEFESKIGECGYTFRTSDGRIHDMLSVGYEGVLVRSEEK